MRYHDCKPVFPSHFIEYKCEFEDCPCRSSGQAKHLGRIRAVAKDERSTTIKATEKGKPVALVIPLMPPRYLEPEHQEALSEYLDDFVRLRASTTMSLLIGLSQDVWMLDSIGSPYRTPLTHLPKEF